MKRLLLNTLDRNNSEQTITDRLRSLVPILGNSEQFVRALHRYQLGKLRLDEKEVDAARVQGFVALVDTAIEAGLLLSIFGRGLLWSSATARSFLLTCYSGRLVRTASLAEFDLIEPLSKRLLDNSSHTRYFMDSVFELTRKAVVSAVKL